jgi:hypothetical protein
VVLLADDYLQDGITRLPDGQCIAWSVEQVSPQAAELFRRQSEARTFRVETLTELPDATFEVRKFDVPGAWLDAFLTDWPDAPGEGEEVLSVESLDDPTRGGRDR